MHLWSSTAKILKATYSSGGKRFPVETLQSGQQRERPQWRHSASIFVYIARETPTRNIDGFCRATGRRVAEAANQIHDYERRTETTLGPITRQHVEVDHARRGGGREFQLRNDQATQMAVHLDETRAALQERRTQATQDADNDIGTLPVEINGGWINLRVRKSDICALLGFPEHDIYFRDIFHPYVHPTIRGPDTEDTDHQDANTQDNEEMQDNQGEETQDTN